MAGSPRRARARAQMRDGATRVLIRNMFFGNTYRPVQLAVIQDIKGDGIPDFAQPARREDTGAVRVQVNRSDTGAMIMNLFANAVSNPVAVALVPDINANSTADLAILGDNNAGMRRVQVSDSLTGARIITIHFP